MSDFAIESTAAPLVEVVGNGPYMDRPDGLAVPAGALTEAPVDLLSGFIRSWRVNAPLTAQTTVSVPQSPYGAFVGLRRCVGQLRWTEKLPAWIARLWWFRRLPFVRLAGPCNWQDVGDGSGTEVQATGGDIVTVTFVAP